MKSPESFEFNTPSNELIDSSAEAVVMERVNAALDCQSSVIGIREEMVRDRVDPQLWEKISEVSRDGLDKSMSLLALGYGIDAVDAMSQDKNVKKHIVSILGIEKLNPQKQDEVITTLEKNIQRKVSVYIIDALKEGDYDDFLSLWEDGDREKLVTFLSERIPDFSNVMKSISREAVDEFLQQKDDSPEHL